MLRQPKVAKTQKSKVTKKAAKKVAKKVHKKQVRHASSMKEIFAEQIPEKREKVTKLNKELGNKIIDKVDVGQVMGGMRGIKAMPWDVSLLDANEGIRFRGYTIPELQELLPGAKRAPGLKKGQMTAEATLFLLMTGKIPTEAQVAELQDDLHQRAKLPAHVINTLKNFPKEMHPMSQLVAGVAAAQTESIFAKKYHTTGKKDLWDAAYEDALNVIARAPIIAAHIYNNTYNNSATPENDTSLDMAANFNRLIGFPAQGKPLKDYSNGSAESADAFDEFMRLYFSIHTDHEGGNVSAHTSRLVGSALSDPYLSYAASMAGLAGPLHGLANQEVLDWNLKLFDRIKKEGKPLNEETVRELAWDTLNSGKVIPGFGHAVLRKTDPRYTVQHQFCLDNIPDFELFQLTNHIYKVMPQVLTEHGKTKNPWPNVDAMSGTPLQAYGLTQTNFYTVLFGVSRGMGVLSQYVHDRATGFGLERPKSLTTDNIMELALKSTETRM
eukprot:UN03310